MEGLRISIWKASHQGTAVVSLSQTSTENWLFSSNDLEQGEAVYVVLALAIKWICMLGLHT